MERTIDQNMSIVQVYAQLFDLRWDNSFKEIVDLPDRIGMIDLAQESFRKAFCRYLSDVITSQKVSNEDL